MEQAYTAIGRAVLAAQAFEIALASIFQFFRMVNEPSYMKQTGGKLPENAFRDPTTKIVRMLKEKGDIAPDFEARLLQYAEDRHTLIHRWVIEHGWPAESDTEGFKPIVALATRVASEAKYLALQLTGYMGKFADPDWASKNEAEYQERMKQLFHRAHIDGGFGNSS